MILALYDFFSDFFLMFDDRPEHSGDPLELPRGVRPNVTLESIDSGDFLAGVMRPGVATALRDGIIGGHQHAPVGLSRGCEDLPRGCGD